MSRTRLSSIGTGAIPIFVVRGVKGDKEEEGGNDVERIADTPGRRVETRVEPNVREGRGVPGDEMDDDDDEEEEEEVAHISLEEDDEDDGVGEPRYSCDRMGGEGMIDEEGEMETKELCRDCLRSGGSFTDASSGAGFKSG